MKQIDIQQEPFNTTDAILAYCLHMAGVEWQNPHEAAKVFYSIDILNKFTNGSGEPFYRGWELERAVEHAHKHGKRGHVEYVFKRTERLPLLVKVFHDQVEYLRKAEGVAHEVVQELIAQRDKLAADVFSVRLCCIMLKLRAEFMDIWRHQVPVVIIPNPGLVRRRELPEGGHIIETPGFRAISLNASKETREHLGL